MLDVNFGETLSEPYENKLMLKQNVSYDDNTHNAYICWICAYVSIYTIKINHITHETVSSERSAGERSELQETVRAGNRTN